MAKRHLKTLTVPVSWPIKRKGQTFVLRPNPGKSFSFSMPIALIFKDLLKICKTAGEIKTTLRDKEVLVDGKRRKNPKYLVGILDVLSIPLTNEHYRMHINKNGKLSLLKITAEEAGLKISKIVGKKTLKGKKIQLNLLDGRNLIVEKDNYAIGDTLVLKLPSQEIKDHIKIETGTVVYMISGKHTGDFGSVEKFEKGILTVKTKDATFETPKNTIIAIGKTKPIIAMHD